jgi:adenylate kinase
LADIHKPLEAVVLLNLDLGVLFKRLTGRRNCQICNQVFNVFTSPPDVAEHLAKKGHEPVLVQRPDDKEEVIGKRLEVYDAQTKPLIKYYTEAGLLRVVNADAEMETVFKGIQEAVGA